MSRAALFLIVVAALACALPASALSFEDGRWRLELSGGAAVDQGGWDRDGDTMWTGYVDYEMPATKHLALSLRAAPLYLYTQDSDSSNHSWWREVFHHHHHDYDSTVWGAGAGLAGRVYQKGGSYEGIFLELEALALLHDGRIAGDSSNVDFLTGVGVGYQFNTNWHAIFRVEHTSNAGLGGDNAGVNTVRMGVGYRF
jgi:hypothetical protein